MINGTLFVQIFHFFVAYLMLKYILFKPALAIVFLQEERILQLNHDIVLLKNTVALETTLKKQQQVAWRHKVAGMKPDIKRSMTMPLQQLPHKISIEDDYTIQPEREQKIIQESVQGIIDILEETVLLREETT